MNIYLHSLKKAFFILLTAFSSCLLAEETKQGALTILPPSEEAMLPFAQEQLRSRHACHLGYRETAILQGTIPGRLTPVGDGLGLEVSIAFNGRYLFVGAPFAQAGGLADAGAVYIFYLNEGGQWILTQTLTTNGMENVFGEGTIRSQGKYLFIPATGTPLGVPSNPNPNFAGALLVYHLSSIPVSGTTAHLWELVQVIDQSTPGLEGLSDGAGLGFNNVVDAKTGWLLIGSGQEAINPLTGEVLPSAGATFAFKLNRLTGLWELKQILTNPTGVRALNFFGSAVAMDKDFAFISDQPEPINGVIQNGTVYVFHLSTHHGWRYVQRLIGDQSLAVTQTSGVSDGFGVWTSMDDGWALIACPFENLLNSTIPLGAAYFYKLQGDRWIKAQKVTSDDFNSTEIGFNYVQLQDRLAIISDSNRSGPAGLQQGGMLVFRRHRGVWQQLPTLLNPNGQPFQYFGQGGAFSSPLLFNGHVTRFFAASSLSSPPVFTGLNPLYIFEAVCEE
ncbi:hypothetical protein [Candidatus Protochlamydia phocaeensis]|uniref:hypothetical protein n=1 Tax=Candidatus Protochlamydia phocaeensis TaxID=1414722 RepID=UPI00083981E1|nr:hypothetical protein [Candidatus Protochlamydia phocaeensis]